MSLASVMTSIAMVPMLLVRVRTTAHPLSLRPSLTTTSNSHVAIIDHHQWQLARNISGCAPYAVEAEAEVVVDDHLAVGRVDVDVLRTAEGGQVRGQKPQDRQRTVYICYVDYMLMSCVRRREGESEGKSHTGQATGQWKNSQRIGKGQPMDSERTTHRTRQRAATGQATGQAKDSQRQ